jgi:hypothetical protein
MADILQDGAPMSPMEMQIAQQAIDRQRQLALALQQSSLQAPEGQMVSGHYVGPSWTQYVSKLAAGLIGKNQQSDLDQKQLGIAKQYNNNMMSIARNLTGANQQSAPASMPNQGDVASAALGAGAQAGSIGPTNTNAANMDAINASLAQQPQAAPQSTGNPMFKGVDPSLLAMYLQQPDSAFGKIAALQIQNNMKNAELPDAVKTNNYYGLNPKNVAEAMARENAAKGQATLRSGNTLIRTNPDGSVAPLFTAPDQATGINTTWVNGQPQAAAIPGVANIRQNLAAAELAGRNQQTLAPKDMSPTLPNGQVVPTTIASTIGGGSAVPNQGFPAGTQVPAPTDTGSIVPGQSDRLSILQQELQNPKNTPADNAAIQREIQRLQPKPQGVGPAFGQEAGAVNAQNELTKKFSDLQAQNSQAQITSSYLQNIKQQAQKAAVGPMSDKIDYINGLLSLVGNEKAKDAVTANDLLDKYSNQIVSRLGTGGLGTDSARAIIQSAYPNAHMNLAAINEAADNLQGANEMVKAKMSLLSQPGNDRNPVAYQQKEMIFDQNADPRIWQYKSITDPNARKAFAKQVIQQDPQFPQKIKALEGIGAL